MFTLENKIIRISVLRIDENFFYSARIPFYKSSYSPDELYPGSNRCCIIMKSIADCRYIRNHC